MVAFWKEKKWDSVKPQKTEDLSLITTIKTQGLQF
jgi:hypothetical protein